MKNQNNNVLIILIIAILVLVAGYFVYANISNRNAGETGQLYNAPNSSYGANGCYSSNKDAYGVWANVCIQAVKGKCTVTQQECNLGGPGHNGPYATGVVVNATGGSSAPSQQGTTIGTQLKPSATTVAPKTTTSSSATVKPLQ